MKSIPHSFTSRRNFLRGFGAALSLPALEAFRPLMAATTAARAIGTTASGAPLRMAYLYIPNGVNLSKWRPSGSGAGYNMGETFSPVEKYKSDFQIFTGFEQKNAKAGSDGPGDHARGTAAFLTSARPKKTAGSDIQLGISVDQVAANAIASHTRLSSLELSADGVRKAGLRFRIFMRLSVQSFLALGKSANDTRSKPARGVRTPLRCRLC